MRRSLEMSKLNLAIAAAIIAAASGPAAAQDGRSRSVSYSDLNLSTPAGIQRLDGRVRRTVEAMCGQSHSTDLTAQAGIRRCRAEAWADYAAQRPVLIAARGANSRVRIAAR
jgi:UrcA family protein